MHSCSPRYERFNLIKKVSKKKNADVGGQMQNPTSFILLVLRINNPSSRRVASRELLDEKGVIHNNNYYT